MPSPTEIPPVPPTVQGILVDLRPVQPGDSQRLRRWRTDPALAQYFLDQRPISEEQHEGWMIQIQNDPTRTAWVVYSRLDGTPKGFAQLMAIDGQAQSAEWGFYLASPEAKMTGLGVDMERCVLIAAFEELGLRQLTCRTLVTNASVILLHKRFGFCDTAQRPAEAFDADGTRRAAVVRHQTVDRTAFLEREPSIRRELQWLADRLAADRNGTEKRT